MVNQIRKCATNSQLGSRLSLKGKFRWIKLSEKSIHISIKQRDGVEVDQQSEH